MENLDPPPPLRGDGDLLFHLILSKIVVKVDAQTESDY